MASGLARAGYGGAARLVVWLASGHGRRSAHRADRLRRQSQ
ncbi:MAG: hypothetical protein ABI868_20200 [Acidobacteriota bacterium]